MQLHDPAQQALPALAAAVEQLLNDGGDAAWDGRQRAALRLELATGKLQSEQAGAAEAIAALWAAASALDPAATWEHLQDPEVRALPARAAALDQLVALLSDGTDTAWEAPQRAALRLELATDKLQAEQADAAANLWAAAAELDPAATWAHLHHAEIRPLAARLPALARLVVRQGDAPWDSAQRAALRLELAHSQLRAQAVDPAAALLAQAGELDAAATWNMLAAPAVRALPARLPTIERLLVLEGDVAWAAPQRAALRLELAESKLAEEQAADAAALWAQAAQLDADATWAHVQSASVRQLAGRLAALDRLVATQDADAVWTHEQRAGLRLELAAAKLKAGQTDGAATLLQQAGALSASPAWAKLYEAALEKQNKPQALVELWLNHLDLWDTDAGLTRVRRAVGMSRQAGSDGQELAALDLLQQLAPDPSHWDRLLELAATLQDRERFGALLTRRYQEAPDVATRVALALRAAPLWLTHFNDPAKAAVLLEDALAESVDPTLVETLRDLYLQQKRALEFVELLRRRAPSLIVGERVALLSRAADVAAAHDAPGVAFELYIDLLRADPTLGHAADFSLEYGRKVGRWPEVVEVLHLRARATGDAQAAGHMLEQAADVARDALGDAGRELAYLEEAVERQASPPRLARLVALHLGTDSGAARAAELLLQGKVDAQEELELALQTVRRLGETPEGDALLAFVSERHPDAPESVAYRLRRARAAGDLQAVMQALQARLANSAMAAAERARLHCEIADAAVQLRKPALAAEHWLHALEDPSTDVALLVRAGQLAEMAGDAALQQRVLERAASARDALAERLESVHDASRSAWLNLLGAVYEATGDDTLAVQAYQELCDLATRRLPPKAVSTLVGLYTRYGQWEPLAALYERVAELTPQPSERGEVLYTLGMLYRDRLGEEDKAITALTRALQVRADLAPAQLELGLLLAKREQFTEALTHLEGRVDTQAEDTPVEHLVALAECYRAANASAEAIDLTGLILAREPQRQPMRRVRAEMLQEAGREDDARAEWETYLSGMRADDPPETLAEIHQRIGRLARRTGDNDTAVRHLEEAFELVTPTLAIMGSLRELYEEGELWQKAADMHNRELVLETDPGAQLVHFRALAELYDQRLDEPSKATVMLERAADLAPRDVALLQDLLERYSPEDDRPKFLLCAERLLAIVDESDVDANFLVRLAEAYEPVDAARAQTFYARALALEPSLGGLRGKQRELALQSGDYATFAATEEDAVAALTDAAERGKRNAALAEVYLQHLNDVDKAVAALIRATQATPADESLWRRLADAYALDARYYEKAMELYRRLLAAAPMEADMLRIVARLAGQMGNTDRAYGYYACLLVITPGDEEGLRFVTACRTARLPVPPRAPTDAERSQGLTHQQQGGPIEELFAPLARFAELTHPGDLTKRGITPGDKLTAEQGRTHLVKMATLLGLPQMDAYTWKAGGAGTDMELLNPPALLVGEGLRAAGMERQLLFLGARGAELYRSGHILCERLAAADLQALLAALCAAVDPNAKAPGMSPQTPPWTKAIAGPMTVQIRAAMAPRVAAYLKAAASLDVNRWRQASLASASRLALVLACDIDEAITALLRARKTEQKGSKPRAVSLKEAPEEMDLFRFAQSEQYFTLRQNLGIALRKSK